MGGLGLFWDRSSSNSSTLTTTPTLLIFLGGGVGILNRDRAQGHHLQQLLPSHKLCLWPFRLLLHTHLRAP